MVKSQTNRHFLGCLNTVWVRVFRFGRKGKKEAKPLEGDDDRYDYSEQDVVYTVNENEPPKSPKNDFVGPFQLLVTPRDSVCVCSKEESTTKIRTRQTNTETEVLGILYSLIDSIAFFERVKQGIEKIDKLDLSSTEIKNKICVASNEQTKSHSEYSSDTKYVGAINNDKINKLSTICKKGTTNHIFYKVNKRKLPNKKENEEENLTCEDKFYEPISKRKKGLLRNKCITRTNERNSVFNSNNNLEPATQVMINESKYIEMKKIIEREDNYDENKKNVQDKRLETVHKCDTPAEFYISNHVTTTEKISKSKPLAKQFNSYLSQEYAIYSTKTNDNKNDLHAEENLDKSFNSLDNQKEMCSPAAVVTNIMDSLLSLNIGEAEINRSSDPFLFYKNKKGYKFETYDLFPGGKDEKSKMEDKLQLDSVLETSKLLIADESHQTKNPAPFSTCKSIEINFSSSKSEKFQKLKKLKDEISDLAFLAGTGDHNYEVHTDSNDESMENPRPQTPEIPNQFCPQENSQDLMIEKDKICEEINTSDWDVAELNVYLKQNNQGVDGIYFNSEECLEQGCQNGTLDTKPVKRMVFSPFEENVLVKLGETSARIDIPELNRLNSAQCIHSVYCEDNNYFEKAFKLVGENLSVFYRTDQATLGNNISLESQAHSQLPEHFRSTEISENFPLQEHRFGTKLRNDSNIETIFHFEEPELNDFQPKNKLGLAPSLMESQQMEKFENATSEVRFDVTTHNEKSLVLENSFCPPSLAVGAEREKQRQLNSSSNPSCPFVASYGQLKQASDNLSQFPLNWNKISVQNATENSGYAHTYSNELSPRQNVIIDPTLSVPNCDLDFIELSDAQEPSTSGQGDEITSFKPYNYYPNWDWKYKNKMSSGHYFSQFNHPDIKQNMIPGTAEENFIHIPSQISCLPENEENLEVSVITSAFNLFDSKVPLKSIHAHCTQAITPSIAISSVIQEQSRQGGRNRHSNFENKSIDFLPALQDLSEFPDADIPEIPKSLNYATVKIGECSCTKYLTDNDDDVGETISCNVETENIEVIKRPKEIGNDLKNGKIQYPLYKISEKMEIGRVLQDSVRYKFAKKDDFESKLTTYEKTEVKKSGKNIVCKGKKKNITYLRKNESGFYSKSKLDSNPNKGTYD